MGCNARETILIHFDVANNKIAKIMSTFYFGALRSAIENIKNEPNILQKEKIKKLKVLLKENDVKDVIKRANKVSLKQKIYFFATLFILPILQVKKQVVKSQLEEQKLNILK